MPSFVRHTPFVLRLCRPSSGIRLCKIFRGLPRTPLKGLSPFSIPQLEAGCAIQLSQKATKEFRISTSHEAQVIDCDSIS
jgi:hypothetical protein